MADFNAGDVLVRLRADATAFQQAIQRAIQQLQQFSQISAQIRQAQTSGQQSTTQLASAYQGLTQAIQRQNQAYAQSQHAAQAAQQHTQALTQSLRTQAAATQQAHNAWQTMLHVAGRVGIATGVAALLVQVKQLATESVSLSARMQDLHIAFRSIEGSSGGANETLARLFGTAQRVGVEFASVVDGFKRMEQAAKGTALQGEGMRQVFEETLKGSRNLGVSSENLSRALVALEQILTKNRAGAEELNQQLGDAIPGSIGMLARALGLSTQDFQEMITLGIVPAQSAVIAFGKAMGEVGESAEPIERLSSTFARLKNEMTAWMTALGDGIGSTLTPLLNILTKISEETRTLLNIRPPGVAATPGSSQRLGLHPLAPRTTGFLSPNPYMPSEFEGTGTGLAFPASRFDALIRQQASRIQFDETLFARLVQQESGFNPEARGPFLPRRNESAIGLGQVLPSTARDYGVTSIAALLEPETNLTTAANVLRDYRTMIQDKFGTLADETRILLAAYNAGIGNVVKAIEETQRAGEPISFAQVLGRLPKPQETGPYVEKITGLPSAMRPLLGQAAGTSLDPFAPMVKTATDVAGTLTAIQKRMDLIGQSGLNVGGILDDALKDEATKALEKYEQLAKMFAAFPEQLARLTPVQREQLALAGQQVALMQERIGKGPAGEMRQQRQERWKELDIFGLTLPPEQEALARETAQEAKQRRQELWKDLDIFGLDMAPEQEQAARQAAEEAKQQRQDLWKEFDILGIMLSPEEEEQVRATAQDAKQRRQELWKSLDIFGLELTPDQERSRAMTQRLQDQLTLVSTPRNERGSARLRTQAERQGMTLTGEQEAIMQQIAAQERFNEILAVTENIGANAASAITSGLMALTEGTQTVAQAFRMMAQSILQSTAQILLNEGFRALIRLGIGAVAGAFMPTMGMTTPGGGYYQASSGGGAPFLPPPIAFQHGGMVNRPTHALIGENPAHNPEYIFNRQQMQSLMRAGPSAGGQAAGVVVMNFPGRQQAEQEAAHQRALGKEVVLNEVLSDLSRGESSQINRMIRTLQR